MSTYAELEKEEKEAEELLKAQLEPEPAPEEGAELEIEPEIEPEPEVLEEDQPPDKTETVDYWKQKFKTVDGKNRAEIPRLTAEVAQWKEFAVGLQGEIDTLKGDLEKVKTSKAPEVEPDDSTFESFAGDYPEIATFITKMKRDYEDKIASLTEKVDTGIPTELKSVQEELKLTKKERFDAELASIVPDWKEIDVDPEFIESLNAKAPYMNATKLQLLQKAVKESDSETVAQFFIDYKATLEEPEPSGQEKLEKFVAPGKPGSGKPPKSGANQQGLTQAGYEKFMASSMKGQFNPKEWGGKTEVQVEAMFMSALRSGKLR